METRHSPVLLVEDSDDDVYFMQRAFKAAGLPNPMFVVRDGLEALEYLQNAGQYTDTVRAPRPGLVLLDLKLPRLKGLDVLKWIAERRDLATIPVIVLTSSNQEQDIERAFELGANSYLVKPASAEKLTELIAALKGYWLHHDQFHRQARRQPSS